MGNKYPGLDVVQSVADIVRATVPVDRDTIGAEQRASLRRLDECEIVAEQQCDSIAFLNANGVKTACRARSVREHLVAIGGTLVEKYPVGGHACSLDRY